MQVAMTMSSVRRCRWRSTTAAITIFRTSLSAPVSDNASRVLASSQTVPADIVHGRWTTVPLAMVIDLSQVDPATVRLLVFHEVFLLRHIHYLQAKYTDRMVTIDLEGIGT